VSCQSRCTGHCCENFILGPPDLYRSRATSPNASEEEKFVDDMLIYKGYLNYQPYNEKPIAEDVPF